MKIIRKLGFVDYFLITWDFIREARSRAIPVGPGRGSAAGSIVSYALRITDIDPLKYGLLFERFLNTDRISMPDIDIDFSKTRRDEVIQYVREKYGQGNVAQIVTFNKLKAKGALKDVGRVLGRPYQEMDRISKLVPDDPKTKLRKAVVDIPELRAEHEKPENRELFDIALKVVGCPRNLSTHAAGVVITPGKLTDYVPLCVVKDVTNTQYEMTALEEIGLLKMDFLGLNTLTIIEAAIDLIKETRGEEIDVAAIPTDDPETFEMLKKGDSLGTFQLESAGMRDVLRKLEPDSLEDLIALIALHRPGPMASIPSFCDCKHGRRPVEFLHESLREILEPTFGFFVYQEQVMRVAQHMAKFTLNEGDMLRKAMGKKLPHVMKKYEKKFIDGAVGNEVNLATAREVWSFIDKFAEYGFNKSHAAAYAVIAVQTAYLKCHYTAEYMAALMTCEMDNTDKVVLYRGDAEERGLTVHPPDIASGRHAFTVKDGEIIFGLGAVKGVGEGAIEAVVKARNRVGKFNSLYHFCDEVDYHFVNRGAMEALIKCGAFDGFGARRPQLLAILEDAMRAGKKKQEDEEIGQDTLFRGKFRPPEPPLPDVPELEELDKLRFEKETLGFYLSGHPLDTYRSDLIAFSSHTTAEFLELNTGSDENGNNIFNARNGRNSRTRAGRDKGPEYIIGGLLAGIRRVTTKKGDPMAFASLTDFEGTIEIVVFPSSYQDVMSQLIEDAVVFCRGHANTNREIPTLAIEEIVPVSEAAGRFAKCCIIRLKSSDILEGAIGTLTEIVAEFPGPTPLYIQLEKSDGSRVLAKCSSKHMISVSEKFRKTITDRIGPGRIHMRGEESMKGEV
jgi:DNA polymerase-3 subunit alpha